MSRSDSIVDTISKGVIGTFTPILGVLTSRQESIEWSFRVAALALGCLVSVVTIVSIWRKMPKR